MEDPRSTRRAPDWAERLVRFLDDGFVVPGTNFRMGFDAVLGLIPGVGDFVMTVTSLSLLWLAWQRGVSKAVLGRMLVNLGIDALAGAVPVLGDLFDIVFKANRRNLDLLERYDRAPREAGMRDGAFLALAALFVIAILTVPLVLAIALLRWTAG